MFTENTVTIITPATGHRTLPRCLRSVQEQSFGLVEHLVGIDGPEYDTTVRQMVQNQEPNQKRVRVLTLPDAVGKNGWNGHRVYGGFSFLVNTECVAYLVLRTRNNVRPLFVSVGHRVDLPTSVELLMSCVKHRVPEPTRLADIEVAKLKRST